MKTILSLILIAALFGCKKDDPCPDWLNGQQKQYDAAVSALVSQQHAGLMTMDQLEERLTNLKGDYQSKQKAEGCCCLDL